MPCKLHRVVTPLGTQLTKIRARPHTFFSSARTRAPPPRCGRLQARRRTELLPTIRLPSTCVWPFRRTPRAPRLDAMTRALRWSRARTPKSGQLVPVQSTVQRPTDGAECARVLCRRCGGEGSAPRAASGAPDCGLPRPGAACPLSLDAQGGGGGGSGDRSYLCSTPSHCDGVMCDGVECVFAFPVGRRAIGRVGARRFDATGVSNHA